MAVTNYPREDYYESELAQDISETDLSLIAQDAVQFDLSSGTFSLYIDNDKPRKRERVIVTAIDATKKIFTITRAAGVAEGVAGVARTHTAGAKLTIAPGFADFKTLVDEKAQGNVVLSGNWTYANDAARDAAIPSPQESDECVSNGVKQVYLGGAWQDLDVGTPTPNASTTVAGKVEIATQAEANAGTDTGGTGAQLSVIPSNLAVLAQDNKYTYAGTTAGTSTAYTATVTPAPSAYAAGQQFTALIDQTNGDDPTINFNSLGAVQIVDHTGANIAAGILPANSLVTFGYNGSAMQVLSVARKSPVRNVYTHTGSKFIANASSTRFDITDEGGNTFRYTYDGTGTDPNINATTVPTGTVIFIDDGVNFNAANDGEFTVTGSGANYFEVTNASGVAESNVTIGSGYIAYRSRVATWTKPDGLLYVIAETQAGGGAISGSSSGTVAVSGGSGGGYCQKLIAASSLGATETVLYGVGGIAGEDIGPNPTQGGDSTFDTMTASGGLPGALGTSAEGVAGGVATGGDINIPGGNSGYSNDSNQTLGAGGSSFMSNSSQVIGVNSSDTSEGGLYGGGASGGVNAPDGKDGGNGIVIITEYYQ